MNLNEAKRMALSLMADHGLLGRGWTFKFDRGLNRFGRCVSRRASFDVSGGGRWVDGERYISLSRPLVRLNDAARVRNTILHEIAHALVGCGNGHNSTWKLCAKSIGCDGERCFETGHSSTSASSMALPPAITPPAKYVGTCPKGHINKKHRKTKKMFRISCGKCAPVYKPENKYTWTCNGKVLVDPSASVVSITNIKTARAEAMRTFLELDMTLSKA